MRYLFVTVDSAGALYPQLALAARLGARGHEVRFLACRSQRTAIERAAFRVRTYSGPPNFDMSDPHGAVRDWHDDPETSFKTCCELIWFGPASAVAADVIDEVEREPADVLVVDYFAFGAAIAGERLGMPTAIVWHTLFGEWPSWDAAGLPTLNAARSGMGLPADESIYSAYHRAERILAPMTETFAGSPPVPANLRYVGAQIPPGHEPRSSAAIASDLPSVLVSLGTSYQAQEGLLRRVVSALGDLPVRAVVTTGGAVTYEANPPDNVEVRAWLTHSEVLPQVDLVVTHAGLGTIINALAFGVPLVCLPMGRDQHANADRVDALGCGVSIKATSSVEDLRFAIDRAVRDDRLRTRARELAACAGDFDVGARELERIGVVAVADGGDGRDS